MIDQSFDPLSLAFIDRSAPTLETLETKINGLRLRRSAPNTNR